MRPIFSISIRISKIDKFLQLGAHFITNVLETQQEAENKDKINLLLGFIYVTH
jgi:hypothetical protein